MKSKSYMELFKRHFPHDSNMLTKTNGFTISKDTLQSGKTYTLTVRAESAYHHHSEPTELTLTIE